jgi:three-Cys-motif partner protein
VWTGNKAKLIERYLYYFVMVTKGGIYLDGFAGPQDPEHSDSWAAKLVMESEPRWLQEFHLFDRGRRQIRALEELKSKQHPRDRSKREPHRTVTIHPGDFNQEALSLLRSGVLKKTRATFCLIDQRTFECHWLTLRALSEYRAGSNKIELFYFLANHWLARALAGSKHPSKLDAWWGRADWRQLQGLRGVERAYLLAGRFRTELGYGAADPYAIYESVDGGRVMYYMIHATDHPAAPGLMSRAYRKSVQPKEPPEQVKLELGLH